MFPVGLSGCGWKTTSVDMDPFPMKTGRSPIGPASGSPQGDAAAISAGQNFGRERPRPPPGVASRSDKPKGQQKFSVLMRPELHKAVRCARRTIPAAVKCATNELYAAVDRSDRRAWRKVGLALVAI